MLTVIIPTYRNPHYLDLCLKSITENSVVDSTQIIVVVDGFIEESEAVLKKYPNVGVLPFESNMGMQYAINAGVMQAETEYVFIINDDNVLPKEWDKRLVDSINKIKDERFVITVNQIEPTGPGMFNFPVMDLGKTSDTFSYEKFLDYELQLASQMITSDGHIFPFVMLKKHFMAVGGFDTFYDSPNICDWDFFLKLELWDFTFPRIHSLHLYHFGSVATKKNQESNTFRIKEQAAMEQYVWKWGAPPYNQPNSNRKTPPNKQFRGFNV